MNDINTDEAKNVLDASTTREIEDNWFEVTCEVCDLSDASGPYMTNGVMNLCVDCFYDYYELIEKDEMEKK